MVRKHKDKRHNRDPNRTSRNERRRGRKQAARDTAFSSMRDAKAAGEERYDEDLIEARVAHEALFDAHRAVEIRAREVQIGSTHKHSFARTAGSVTVVKTDFLRKPRAQDWQDYKVNVAAKLAVSNMPEARLRVTKREAWQDYMDELVSVLTEKLRLVVLPSRFVGSMGQGQRKREINRWQRAFAQPRACFIVPDAGPTVVMATRKVVLNGSMEQLEHWSEFFAPERQDVLNRYSQDALAAAAARLKILEDAPADLPLVKGEFQSFPDASLEALSSFAKLAGSLALSDATSFIERHWPAMVALSAELAALSLVPVANRPAYLAARVTSEAFRDLGRVEGVKSFLLELVLHDAVVGIAEACARSVRGPPDVVSADFQGFASFISEGFSAAITPGTAVNGLVILGAAGAVLLQTKEDNTISIAHASSTLFRLVAKIPACATPQDAVMIIIRHLPAVFSAVLAAARLGSLRAFVVGGDSTVMRFAKVQAGFELHRQGLYPNTEFSDTDAFLREVEECYEDLAPLARRGEPSAVRIWSEATSIRASLRNDVMGMLRPSPFSLAFVGESGIGKSVILSLCRDFLTREHFGRPTPPERIHTIQCTDQYASGYKMSHEVIVYDDVFNARAGPGVSVSNPTAPIIEIVNNITTPLNMADLSSKGKIAYRSPFFFATSNVEGLGATHYSNEPVSVLRRFNLFIRPTVRPEYRLHGTMMLDPTKVPDPSVIPVPDLWSFELWTVYKHNTDAGTPLQKFDVHLPGAGTIIDLIELLSSMMKQHFASQDALCSSQREKPYIGLTLAQLRERLVPAVAVPPVVVDLADMPPLVVGEVQMFAAMRAHLPPMTEPAITAGTLGLHNLEQIRQRVQGYGLQFVERARDTSSELVSYGFRLWAWSLFGGALEDFFSPFNTWLLCAVGMLYGYAACGAFVLCLPVCRAVARLSWASFLPRRGALALPGSQAAVAATAVALIAWLVLRPRKREAHFQGITEFVQDPKQERATVDPVVVPAQVRTSTYRQLRNMAGKHSRFALFESGAAVGMGVVFPIQDNLYVTNAHIMAPFLQSSSPTIKIALVSRASKTTQRFSISKSQVWQPNMAHDIVFLYIVGPKEKDFSNLVLPDLMYQQMVQQGANLHLANACVAVTRAGPDILAGTCADVPAALQLHHFGMQGPPVCRRVAFDRGEFVCLALRPLHGATQQGDCGSPLVLSLRADRGDVTVIAGLLSGVSRHGGVDTNMYAPVLASYVTRATAHFARAVFQASSTFVVPLVGSSDTLGSGGSAAPPIALFGQPDDLHLATTRRHPALPGDVGSSVRAIGVLVDKTGANRNSTNSFASNLKRGVFFKDDEVDAVLGVCGHFFPPNPKSIDHFVRPLEAMGKKRDDFDEDVLATAHADLVASWRLCFCSTKLPARPATLFEASNSDGVQSPYILRTSGGFGHKGDKRPYFEAACSHGCAVDGCARYHPVVGEYVMPNRPNVYPKPPIVAEVEDLISRLAAGERNLAVFKGSLKDEVVAVGKDKIRAFYVGSIPVNIVVRMFLMPFMSRLQGVAGYECSVGINVLSQDWENLQVELEQFGSRKRLAGDYKGFDLSTHPRLLEGFYDAIATMAIDAGWPERDIAVIRGLRNNLAHPVYIMLGQVYLVDGSNPSGVSITTHANSGVNALLHRYAFYERNPGLVGRPVLHSASRTRFSSVVTLKTYGDDVIGAVWDADVGPPPPYEVIDNLDVARAASRFGMVYGPCDKGGGELPAYYDRDAVEFLKCASVFLPEADFRVGRLALSSIRKSLAFESNDDMGARISTMQSALGLYFPHAACEGGTGREAYDRLRSRFVHKLAELAEVPPDCFNDSVLPTYDDVLVRVIGSKPATLFDELVKGEFQNKQCRECGSVGRDYFFVSMASHVQESVVNNVEQEVSRELVGFYEAAPAPSVGHSDSGSMPIVRDESGVSRFLERPVRIATVSWGVGDTIFQTFDPWTLFLSDPAVQERISYFARLRGDLIVRLVVNGTPMHYGCARLCYRPHPLLQSSGDPVFNHAVSVDSGSCSENYRMVMSQLSGFDVNPCFFANGELRIPYMSPLPGLDLVSKIYGTMGTLHLHGYTTLEHANDGTNPVTMELYVHMEGAVLDVPTAKHQGYTMQDARAVVSRILRAGAKATAVAHEWTPRVLTAAALLGFSRPLEHDVPIATRAIPFALANYDAPDTAECLALCSSTEHTLGGQELGTTGEDELVLSRLAARSALITIGSWHSEDARGTFIAGSVVTPMQALVADYVMHRGAVQYSTVQQACLTPCGFASAVARFWHGIMVYKFTVICSPYHKGRLRIYFEPDPSRFPLPPPMNLTNSAILDLAESNTLTVEVPWQNARDMLPVAGMWKTSTHNNPGVFELRLDDETTATSNGIIVCEVLSPLTGLVSTSDVRILVEVSAKELVLYGPRSPGSGVGLCTDAGAIPYTPQAFDLTGGDSIASLRQLIKRYVCEYSTAVQNEDSTADALTTIQVALPCSFPVAGYPDQALSDWSLDQALTGEGVNYTQMSFHTYVAQAFAMVRGAVRWKVATVCSSNTRMGQPIMVSRSIPTLPARIYRRSAFRSYSPARTDPSLRARQYFLARSRRASTGAQLSGGSSGSGGSFQALDVEFPFESYARAVNPRTPLGQYVSPAQAEGTGTQNALLTVELAPSGHAATSNAYAIIDVYTAAGEDFNVFGFIHAPAFLDAIPLPGA